MHMRTQRISARSLINNIKRTQRDRIDLIAAIGQLISRINILS